MKKQPIAMTMKSFCPLFSKSGGVKGQSPLWDFKGRSPLTETDKKTPHLSGEEFFSCDKFIGNTGTPGI